MESAGYFREKAEQCRRLASCILTRNDPTAVSLAALAREFDAAAAAIEAMPRYFLTLTSNTVSRMPNDPEPQEHANMEAARAEAVKSILEIAAEAISSGRPDLPIEAIDITDEEGKLFVSVPGSEALGGTAR